MSTVKSVWCVSSPTTLTVRTSRSVFLKTDFSGFVTSSRLSTSTPAKQSKSTVTTTRRCEMIVTYRQSGGVFVEFAPTEMAEALIFVEAIQRATDSADVQQIVNKMRLDMEYTEDADNVHICIKCFTPIYPRQLATVDKDGYRCHGICPKLKPESERDIN